MNADLRKADPLPPMQPAEKKEFEDVIAATLPDLFKQCDKHGECFFRDVAMKFVQQDLQQRSGSRLLGVYEPRPIFGLC